MLTSILQTLAELLAGGTALTSTEQIDFSHPAQLREQSIGPLLNLYLYDIRESKQMQHSSRQVERHVEGSRHAATVNWSPNWLDVSMVISVRDRTTLGEHHLLSEALSLLLRHRLLREEFLVPELRGHGNLVMTVAVDPPIEIGSLWSALTMPLRPALYVTVCIPVESQKSPASLVWERVQRVNSAWQEGAAGNLTTRRVAIAGLVKNAITLQPLADVEVSLLGTEKLVTSNSEGLFFFDNLSVGNYLLRLNCPGYESQNCNMLVDKSTYTFKEVLLTPS